MLTRRTQTSRSIRSVVTLVLTFMVTALILLTQRPLIRSILTVLASVTELLYLDTLSGLVTQEAGVVTSQRGRRTLSLVTSIITV